MGDVVHRDGLGDLEVEDRGLEPGLPDDPAHVRGEVALLELPRRDVHGDAHRNRPGRLPRPQLLARPPEDPLAHARDEADVLGERDELARRQDALLGVPPADEGLDADDRSVPQPVDGLVVQDELAARKGPPEARLEGGALLRLFLHFPREELEAVAPRLLRAVHRGVDVRDERLGVGAVARVHPDADGRFDEEFALLHEERLGQDPEDLARHGGGVGLSRDPVEEEQKLVAADAGHGVVLPDAAAQPIGDLDEKFVAGRVAERVVHALEVIEVEEHDDERLPAALGVQDREREPVVEEDTVREVRERVVVRLVPALLLGALAVRDVDEASVHDGVAVGLVHEALVREHPHGAPVPAPEADFEVHEDALLFEARDEGLPVAGVRVQVERRDPEDVLAGRVAEDAREGGVAIEDLPVERRAVQTREVPLEEEAVAPLRGGHRCVAPLEHPRDEDGCGHAEPDEKERHDGDDGIEARPEYARGLVERGREAILEEGGLVVELLEPHVIGGARLRRHAAGLEILVNDDRERLELVDDGVRALPDLDGPLDVLRVPEARQDGDHFVCVGGGVAPLEESLKGGRRVGRRAGHRESGLAVAPGHGKQSVEPPVVGFLAIRVQIARECVDGLLLRLGPRGLRRHEGPDPGEGRHPDGSRDENRGDDRHEQDDKERHETRGLRRGVAWKPPGARFRTRGDACRGAREIIGRRGRKPRRR